MSEHQTGRLNRLNRRAFLKGGTLLLAGSALLPGDLPAATNAKPRTRIGLVTDLHYADKAPAETRYYRETLTKFSEAARHFQESKVDLVIELGDLIDGGDSPEIEKGYLRRIAKEFKALLGQHHFVLGNHCVYSLTKTEFLDIVGQKQTYYSFDAGGYHSVVLDACFRTDGQPYGRKNFQWTDSNIPPAEAEWLQADLARTSRKTIVFIHQRLDVEPPVGVRNAPQVRKILEESRKVLAVLQGHHHQNDHKDTGGVHYCTLKAMIEGSGPENNAYAILDILPGDAIRITGFRKQKTYQWS